jgi:serine/threonine protein kinase
MTPARFQELRRTFEQLSDLPPGERAHSLKEISRRDASLSEELRRMLDAHDDTATVLDTSPMLQMRAAVPANTHLGPYQILREVGRGGMGNVYEAIRVDGGFEKRVAIKILRRDAGGSAFLRRFQRERQILARLEHPHIAGIFDGGETADGDPYFVMEFVDGIPITKYAEAHSLGIPAKVDLFLQVCDAVQYAHRNLTIHRDLKPSNILVSSDGSVKLLDFGIAKLIAGDRDAASDGGAATEAILTPAYTSPEQIRKEPATTATDVFQLGILLYELLAGVHPFQSAQDLPLNMMRAICEEDPVPPSVAALKDSKQLRGDLDTIVLTALRKEPVRRYLTVEQMAADVERYRRGWPVLARGNSAAYRLKKFVRRQWLPLLAGTVVVLSLAAGLLATFYQARNADVARAAAERARNQAEQERIVADRQRRIAEQAQLVAVEQRGVADARTKEAEIEKTREQMRYREVRSLASSLLFDLYDGVRDLAGSSTAKRLIVAKVQHQLELLSAEAGDAIGLERDLAACYERMGELRMDPGSGKAGANAAVESYQKAVDLRRHIAARSDSALADQRDLARSLAKLGDGQFLASANKAALASHESAWVLAQSLVKSHPGNASLQQTLGWIDGRRCTVMMASGNSGPALEACQEAISLLAPLASGAPDDIEVQRLIATTEFAYANALRLTNHPQDALNFTRQSLDSLHRLETLAPNNAEYRRLDSSAQLVLANSFSAVGDWRASLDAFRRSVHSMETAIEIDPADLGAPLRLAYALRGFSRRLASAGNRDEAHDADREALDLLRTTSERPGAGPVEWNEYADALLKIEWPDLRRWNEALDFAERAAAKSQRKNPLILDTLAWAYYRNKRPADAVATEREALALLPASARGGLHDELERGLKTFLAPDAP